MVDVEVQIKILHPHAVVPAYMSENAAGMDLHALLEEELQLEPGERALIPTGVAIALPPGFEAQIRPRSGLALREGIALVNAPGTIDADYRGEIKLIIINHGHRPVTINNGERIAQMVVAPVARALLRQVDNLDETGRGSGGFGHTGV